MKSPRLLAATAAVSVTLPLLPANAGNDPWHNLSRTLHAFGGEVSEVKSQFTERENRRSGSSEHSRRHRVSSHHKTRSHPDDQDDQNGTSERAGNGSAPSKHPKATPAPEPEKSPAPSSRPHSATVSSNAVPGENTGEKPGATPVPAQVSSLPPEALKEYA